MNQKDIRLLWGRAGSRCSICRAELSEDSKASGAAFTLGEQAHIVGEKPGAARGESLLTSDERESYHNRILLCPTDHTIVDKNVADWPVEKLHYTKSAHELWVRETLADSADRRLLAKQVAVTTTIDQAVFLCQLEGWNGWAESALSADPQWPIGLPDGLARFRQHVAAAIWPSEFEELERATISMALLLNSAATEFLEHAEMRDRAYVPHKFYKAMRFNPNYERDLRLYNEWLFRCYALVQEATKAANWFADVVRRDINPMFFAERGRFLIPEAAMPRASFRSNILQFGDAEKAQLPRKLLETGAAGDGQE
jgi:hypothetical protein